MWPIQRLPILRGPGPATATRTGLSVVPPRVVAVGTRWSVDQVIAAAPDSASQVAGRRLARPGPWSAIGGVGRAAVGGVPGLGKTPYRVTVDTGTRRYQCSCPSRKFPCKHALGLLFLWAEDRIDASGEIAGFAKDFADRGRGTTNRDGGSAG